MDKTNMPNVNLDNYITAPTTINTLVFDTKKDIKSSIRDKLTFVADDKTMYGITSDVTNILTFTLSFLIKSIAESNTIEELKEKLLAADITPFAINIQNLIESGELKLPYLVKDGKTAGVLSDFMKLNKGIESVLVSK